MQRRSLFGLLAAPLVALVAPASVEAEAPVACQHEAINVGENHNLFMLQVCDEEAGMVTTAEWHLCRHCGAPFTTSTREPLKPLPTDAPPGCSYSRRERNVEILGKRQYE